MILFNTVHYYTTKSNSVVSFTTISASFTPSLGSSTDIETTLPKVFLKDIINVFVVSVEIPHLKKYDIVDEMDIFKPSIYFREVRENIYKNMVKEVLNTIEHNMELAESSIENTKIYFIRVV